MERSRRKRDKIIEQKMRQRASRTVSFVKCHLSTTMTIIAHQFEDRCHISMHEYVNNVSKYVYHGSNVLFLGVLSKPIVTAPETHPNQTGEEEDPRERRRRGSAG